MVHTTCLASCGTTLGNTRKVSKPPRMIVHHQATPSPPPPRKSESPANTIPAVRAPEKQKLNAPRNALPHTKTSARPKHTASDRGHAGRIPEKITGQPE